MVARFRENIPTVKSVLSSRDLEKFWVFDRNYDFALFPNIGIFSGLTGSMDVQVQNSDGSVGAFARPRKTLHEGLCWPLSTWDSQEREDVKRT